MRLFAVFTLALLLFGCDIPSASPEKNPILVIATDRYSDADSLLFQEFAQKHNAVIIIRKITTDSLLALNERKPFETGIDIILIHHLYDMRKIVQTDILETIREEHLPKKGQHPESRKFVSCGIDPFVCVSKPGVSINVFADLTQHAYIFDLSPKSEAHFFAPFEEKMHRAKTFERIEELKASSLPKKAWYADTAAAILTTYSEYRNRDENDTIWSVFTNVQFTNRFTSGVFHDKVTAGIIAQSSHYLLSTQFIKWLVKDEINKQFTANRGYEPLRSSGEYRIYATPPEKLFQYHTMIDRMLDEMH